MAWWRKKKDEQLAPDTEKKSVAKGVFAKCDGCSEIILADDLAANLRVCPKCDFHFTLPTDERMALVLDDGTMEEFDEGLAPGDPLGFSDSKRYRDRVRAAQRSAGTAEAYRWGVGNIGGAPAACGFFVFEYMGGSMGSVVGEKVTRQIEGALHRRLPAVIFTASGGARMQEGILSLMQMAKTTAALGRLRGARLPFISVLLHPTTGGVAASFAMLGDVIVAEPRALVGFAGPRVIEQTIREKLPEGFQRSEFLLEHGMLDLIVHRRDLKSEIGRLLRHLS